MAGLSIGGGKNKSKSSQTQTQNSTSTYTPSQEFLGLLNPVLGQAQGLIGQGYSPVNQEQVQGYLNPYMDAVSSGLRRQADIGATNLDGQAAAAKAFGGSGWGLLRAENERALLDTEAQSQAAAYDRALAAAMGENQAGASFDLNALGQYGGLLGLLGNWGTTNSSGTATSKGKGTQMDLNFGWKSNSGSGG